MDKKQVMQHMLKELDWLVGFYKELQAEERDMVTRNNVAVEFKHYAAAFNSLLSNVYEMDKKFPIKIEKFIANREMYNTK